jgi:acetoin utilization deacetylase AcuC-like enzyme
MLGGLALSVDGFFRVAQLIREVADRVCNGRVVLMPGSGYNPKILPLCWYALVAGIAGVKEIGVKEPYPVPVEPAECRRTVERTVDELRRLLRKHWNCFGGYSLNTMP